MNLTTRLTGLLTFFALCATARGAGAEAYPRPGEAFGTPIRQALLDAEVFKAWVEGAEVTPEGRDAAQGPAWVVWTEDGRKIGHSGLAFGLAKVAGPRHLRVGLTEAVPVGTVWTRGNVRVGVLKPTAAYPGDLGDDSQWLAGQRLIDGAPTSDQTSRDEVALWVFPAGTRTRALRFTHEADPADPTYEGWLGGALVIEKRVLNLAPRAVPRTQSNSRFADKVTNGMTDGWGCWENVDQRADLADWPVVSAQHPEWIQLTWAEPVELSGLAAVWAGFGAATIQVYAGPPTRHPREATEADWETVASPGGFECGYPATFWPNDFPFEHPVRTRAVRVLLTAVTPASHPHVKNKPADGKRVWLGELLALHPLGERPLNSLSLAAVRAPAVHPPIAVPFTLPEAGYVALVIEDQRGNRVRNLVSETPFPAGDNVAWWDGADDLGRDVDAAAHGLYNVPAKLVAPGTYRARGLWRKEIQPFYEFPVYNAGTPPWSTPDHTGGWLANHTPPSAAVFVPASQSPTGEPVVFLGCYVTEGPDGLAWVDLDGKKRGGMKWVGGNWTAAPFLCREVAPDASTTTSVYVGSVWETQKQSGIDELRLTALDRTDNGQLKPRPLYKAVIGNEEPREPGQRSGRGKRIRLGGIAAYGGVIACSFPDGDQLLFIDAAGGEVAGEVAVEDPRGMAYDAKGRLFLLSGRQLVQLDVSLPTTSKNVLVSEGLEDPIAVALDGRGNFYVSDWGESHLVKVFSPAGKPLRVIGHSGAPSAGPYDKLHMNRPAGLAVDERNQLWLTENDYLPKRVSVWSLDGRLIRAVYGPGKYGGGGALDAQDPNRFYYADESRGTLEFRLDWEAGRAELVAVLYRHTPESLELPFRSAAPETAIYRDGKRYFTNCFNTNPTNGHGTALVYLERSGVARPVAAMGQALDWELLKRDSFRALWPEGADPDGGRWQNGGSNQALFAWSDLNEDAHVQPQEVKLWHVPVRGVTVMTDLSFCLANAGGRALRLRPTGFVGGGVPTYDYARAEVLAEGVLAPKSSGGAQVLADDSDEALITLGVTPFDAYSLCGLRGGKAVWSYPSLWPGLHASHVAAKPDRPGELIGTTRLLGHFVTPRGSQVGPLWAVNGNMGNLYLFTRDGLFVGTVFEDVRQGKLWRMPVAQRGMSLKGLTLHDENFWPSLSQTPDGQVYLVDGSNCSLVRLEGLDSLRPIPPFEVKVTAEDLRAAQAYVVQQEALRQETFGRGLLIAALRKTPPTVDGKLDDWIEAQWAEIDRRGAGANFNSNAQPYNIRGALAAAGGRLYVAWDTHEPKLLTNSGELPNALFKTGGALDLMLGTEPSADPNRRQPVAGDLRLLVTLVDKKPRAVLYRQVAPGAPQARAVPFSSPWRTVTFDEVVEVSDRVTLAADGKGSFEVSVPLALLGLQPQPGQRLKGDLGILRGTTGETTARVYWNNKATAITADVPSEAALTPGLWGSIEWR